METRVRRFAFLIALTPLVVACLGTTVGADPARPTSIVPPRQTTASRPQTPAPSRSLVALAVQPPESCAVTKPAAAFVPPSSVPERPPAYYRARWYGTPALWTMLGRDGEIWAKLPQGPHGFGQKTFWWSSEWKPNEEPEPAIVVTGQQLDGPGKFATTGPGTNATADFGTAMLIGIDIPSAGCWYLTGIYRGASLGYVAWIPG
jgi:hypothetical protein